MKFCPPKVLTVRNIVLFIIAALLVTACQKELPLPEQNPTYVKVASDTFLIQAFYGQQRLSPPSVGTVIFPLAGYEVPTASKLAVMSAYTGRNGYGDSAGTIKKNAINNFNDEYYNTDVNAAPNARIILIPINRPRPDFNTLSEDSSFVFTKFFGQSRKVAISISLVSGAWEHRDTAINGKITVYQMNPLLLAATESVETGLATQNSVQKMATGLSEFYMGFVNQKGVILQQPRQPGGKVIAWRPAFYSK